MTSEEFQEFLSYRTDRDLFEKEVDSVWKKHEVLAQKVLWAIEQDSKKTGQIKIADHDHASDLLEMANEVFC